jgi:hypothetical protein
MYSFTKHCLLLWGGCLAAGVIQAQNTTSPYSVYGLGDIEHRAYNRTSGMGNTGLALRSSWFIVDNNPASLSGLDRSFYVFNVGFSGRSNQYAGDVITDDNRTSRDFGVKRVSLATKLNNVWASSVGFQQYSRVNYLYAGSQPVEGTNTEYTTAYEGNGGLNSFHWTNAFAIGKKFSAGVKLNVLTGSINKTETITAGSVIETQVQDYYSKLRLEYGLQYSTSPGKKWNFSIGARMTPKSALNSESTLTVNENATAIVKDKPIDGTPYSVPATYGLGIALTKNNRITVAADYTYENWEDLHIKGTGWSMVNSHRVSGGVQFSNIVRVFNQPVEKSFFQLGGFYNNSSLNVRNNQIKEYGFTAGYGGAYRSLLYNLALEAGSRGTITSGLIRENYVQLTIGFSYRDFLFSKGRKYD